MNEELSQLDADLKGFFVEGNLDEINVMLTEQSEDTIIEIVNFNWNIIKKYYDTKNFELLFRYLKFVAYTCYIMEYAHQLGALDDASFDARMMVYSDIYEQKKQLES